MQLNGLKQAVLSRPELNVGMVLPLFKLATLALRTLSKPIATKLKTAAGFSPRFRHSIISIAQANHRLTTTLQRRIYGHATNVDIRPLNEEKAIQAAADLLGELFVFSVAGAAIIYEVHRNARSEAKKEELRKKEIEELRRRDAEFSKEIELLRHRLQQLEQQPWGLGLARLFWYNPYKQDQNKEGESVKSS